HGSQLTKVHVHHVQVQRLALADVSTTVGTHIDNRTLADFPNRFVQVFDVLRNVRDVLYGAVGSDNGILHSVVPDAQADQVFGQVLVHHHTLTPQHAAHLNVRRIRLKRLVVTQDLCR